eukprot:g5534.t1
MAAHGQRWHGPCLQLRRCVCCTCSGCVSVLSTPGQTESTLYKSGTEETLLSSASFSPGSTVGSSPVRDFFWEQQDQDLLFWASGVLRRDLVCALEAELSSPQYEAQQLQMKEQAPAAAGTAKYRALVTTSVCETLRHTLSERRHPRSGAALHDILAEQFILASDSEQQEREQREQQLVSEWIRKADEIVEELSLQQSLIEGWVQANLQTLLRPLRPLASYRSVAAVYRHAADRTKLFLVQAERKLLAPAGARDADHVQLGRVAAADTVASRGHSETEVQAQHRREQGRTRSDSASVEILESCVRKLGRPRTELMVGASVGIDPLAVAPYCREGVAEAVADFLVQVAESVEDLRREAGVSTVSAPPASSSAWSALEPCAEQQKGVAQLNSENDPAESLPKPAEPKPPSVSTCGRPSSLLELFFPEGPAAKKSAAIEAAGRAVDLSARRNGMSGVTESCAAKLIAPFLIVADESQWPAAVRTFRRFLARLRFGRTNEGKLEFCSKRECMGCSDECYLLAVIYLDRVASKNEGLLLHMRKNTLHFLLLTALVVAAKFWDDDYLSMAQYARAGCTTKAQLADMERRFLKLLGYELDVAPQEFMWYAEQLSAIASAEKARKIAVQQEVVLSSRGGADGVVLDGGGGGAVTPAPGLCADKKDGQEPPGRADGAHLLRKMQLEGEGSKTSTIKMRQSGSTIARRAPRHRLWNKLQLFLAAALFSLLADAEKVTMKFGGSSLATGEKILQVAEIIRKTQMLNEGDQEVVVICSAMGKTTDALKDLLRLATEEAAAPEGQEEDALPAAITTVFEEKIVKYHFDLFNEVKQKAPIEENQYVMAGLWESQIEKPLLSQLRNEIYEIYKEAQSIYKKRAEKLAREKELAELQHAAALDLETYASPGDPHGAVAGDGRVLGPVGQLQQPAPPSLDLLLRGLAGATPMNKSAEVYLHKFLKSLTLSNTTTAITTTTKGGKAVDPIQALRAQHADELVSYGERISVRIVVEALHFVEDLKGAQAFDAWDLGLTTSAGSGQLDSVHSSAEVDTDVVYPEIRAKLGSERQRSEANLCRLLSFSPKAATVVPAGVSFLARLDSGVSFLPLTGDSQHPPAQAPRPAQQVAQGSPQAGANIRRAATSMSMCSTSTSFLPVITGFIAKDAQKRITTLGRDGSDFSAALFGAAVEADRVQIFKDVPGIQSTDPRLLGADGKKRVRTIPWLSYQQASELAIFGATVVHPRAMKPLQDLKNPIPLEVRDTNDWNGEIYSTIGPADLALRQHRSAASSPSGATHVCNEPGGVLAITKNDRAQLIQISSAAMVQTSGFLADVFQVFKELDISYTGKSTSFSLSLTTDGLTEKLDQKLQLARNRLEELPGLGGAAVGVRLKGEAATLTLILGSSPHHGILNGGKKHESSGSLSAQEDSAGAETESDENAADAYQLMPDKVMWQVQKLLNEQVKIPLKVVTKANENQITFVLGGSKHKEKVMKAVDAVHRAFVEERSC